jgi:hypothetical protein
MYSRTGIFVCPKGSVDDQCVGDGPLPNITTTFAVYHRKSSIVTSRSNFSILAVTDVMDAEIDPELDMNGFKQALNWMLDFDKAGIPSVSSIVGIFWGGQEQLSNTYWEPELIATFESILAYPIWFFNWNNFGNVNLSARVMSANLPKEFYTAATLTRPYTKIELSRPFVIAFLLLECIVLLSVVASLVWLCIGTKAFPKLTSFPIMNFLLKARHNINTRSIKFWEKGNDDLYLVGDSEVLKHLSRLNPVTCAPGLAFQETDTERTKTLLTELTFPGEKIRSVTL